MTFSSHNPASGQTVWEGRAAGKREIDEAVQAAKNAFAAWSEKKIEERIEILKNFQNQLEKEKESLAKTISQEMGKPLWESLTEIEAIKNKVPISIEAQEKRCKTEHSHGVSTRFRPRGVAAVLGPFNFPCHLPAGHIIPALLAGNTVVFKPSDKTPKSGEELVRLFDQSGVPKGVVNLVQGKVETGKDLADHPGIDALFFTGSCQAGLSLAKKFSSRLDKILALELGGNNPLVIGEVKNWEGAHLLTMQSAFLTSGQRCSSARRLIIQEKDVKKFLPKLVAKTEKILIGPYDADPEPFMGPLVNAEAADNCLSRQDLLISLGAEPLLPMKRIKGTFVTAGILDVTGVENIPDEEIFAPLLQVIRVKNFAEAIEEANNTRFGLTASCFTDSDEEWEQFYKKIRAGVVNRNRPTNGASSHAPFGGMGFSGNDRPSGYLACDYCNYPVASMTEQTLQTPKNTRL